jgi:hypothetical protein
MVDICFEFRSHACRKLLYTFNGGSLFVAEMAVKRRGFA